MMNKHEQDESYKDLVHQSCKRIGL